MSKRMPFANILGLYKGVYWRMKKKSIGGAILYKLPPFKQIQAGRGPVAKTAVGASNVGDTNIQQGRPEIHPGTLYIGARTLMYYRYSSLRRESNKVLQHIIY